MDGSYIALLKEIRARNEFRIVVDSSVRTAQHVLKQVCAPIFMTLFACALCPDHFIGLNYRNTFNPTSVIGANENFLIDTRIGFSDIDFY